MLRVMNMTPRVSDTRIMDLREAKGYQVLKHNQCRHPSSSDLTYSLIDS